MTRLNNRMIFHRTAFLRREGMLLICALSLIMPAIAQTADEAVENDGIYPDSTVIGFFQRTSGWIASDGALSVPLSDGRTLWLMGDSHIDDYDSVSGTIPCLFQVRNAALLQPSADWDWTHTETLTGDGPGFRNFFKRTADDRYWFWPGAGIQLGDTVYVYCGELMKAGEGTFGFEATGNDMWAKIKFPEMEIVEYAPLPDFDDINFGGGFVDDPESGYVYAYGFKLIPMTAGSEIYLARFRADAPGASWEYWTGKAWTADIKQISAIASGAISPYVTRVNSTYLVLSTQLSVACDQGREIYLSVSDQPAGPFTAPRKIYSITDTVQGHYPFFYTVAAHPQFINAQNELLVTYCINGYGPCLEFCPGGRANPDHYRPRAIRVPLDSLRANIMSE